MLPPLQGSTPTPSPPCPVGKVWILLSWLINNTCVHSRCSHKYLLRSTFLCFVTEFTGRVNNNVMLSLSVFIMQTCPCNSCKNDNFQVNYFDIFLIFAQNIDCGYTSTHNLCLRAKIRKKMYTPVNPIL